MTNKSLTVRALVVGAAIFAAFSCSILAGLEALAAGEASGALAGRVADVKVAAEASAVMAGTSDSLSNRLSAEPGQQLEDRLWGIICLSSANGRLKPDHKSELGTQILMGEVVRVWKRSTNATYAWFFVQSADGYLSWVEKSSFAPCTQAEVDAWKGAPRLVVTDLEERVLEEPATGAQPVSDVVTCNVLKKIGEHGDWFNVQLPDGRVGFLSKSAAQDYALWKGSRRATPEAIERTARQFMGRPYLWGGATPRGFDCSGFAKLVYFLNGIDLKRDSAEQARQGSVVPLDADLSQLRKGDLVFFGRRAQAGQPERVVHVGIYLGDKLFAHASGMVHISSLDPGSALRDEHRIRTLLCARRILGADEHHAMHD